MNRINLGLGGAGMLVLLFPSPVLADAVDNASMAFRAKDYVRARALVTQYYALGGAKRYRADFIRAVSECKLYHGTSGPLSRLRKLHLDYRLSAAFASEVNSWISWCSPREAQAQPAGGQVGVQVSGLGQEPAANSIAGVEPRALPSMTALAYGRAYRGADYARPTRPSAASCQRTCQLEARCQAMTYDTTEKICWLKQSVPSTGYGQGWVSSRKIGN